MHGGALVLAAGFSRRFGSDKRKHLIDEKDTLLIACLRLHTRVFTHTAVVLRTDDAELVTTIDTAFQQHPGLKILFSRNAHLGMGHTISDAISQLSDWCYIALALADMPRISPDTLERIQRTLITSSQQSTPQIVQPLYKGQPGHPVGFTREFFDDLERLTGDQGARELLQQYKHQLIQIDTDDPGTIWDLDERTQLDRL